MEGPQGANLAVFVPTLASVDRPPYTYAAPQIQDPVSPCNLASVANRDLSGQDTLSLLRDYSLSGILFQVRELLAVELPRQHVQSI
jgi:hypothetical protein